MAGIKHTPPILGTFDIKCLLALVFKREKGQALILTGNSR